jgi:hypothetical protein
VAYKKPSDVAAKGLYIKQDQFSPVLCNIAITTQQISTLSLSLLAKSHRSIVPEGRKKSLGKGFHSGAMATNCPH